MRNSGKKNMIDNYDSITLDLKLYINNAYFFEIMKKANSNNSFLTYEQM